MEQIGNYVGVGKSTVKKWENGAIENLKRDKIAKLAKILQLNPVSLVNGEFIPIDAPQTITPTLTFTPDPAALTQTFLTFSFNGKPGARETAQPSVDAMNEINKLAKILRLCPVEEITALLKFVEKGGNIPLQAELPAELRELVTAAAKLPKEDIETLILLAKKMNK